MQLQIAVTPTLSEAQQQVVDALQQAAFADVPADEIEEDFYCTEDAHILALVDNDIVGYAGIYHADVTFQGQDIRLGGLGGVCTRQDMQGRGIATRVCETAMTYLKQRGDDIAFLSINMTKGTDWLYQKVGFVLLPRKFSWTNIHHELKEDMGGMIAPVNSQALFTYVLNGMDVFYVGRGYW